MCSGLSPQSAAISLSIDRKAAYPNPEVFQDDDGLGAVAKLFE